MTSHCRPIHTVTLAALTLLGAAFSTSLEAHAGPPAESFARQLTGGRAPRSRGGAIANIMRGISSSGLALGKSGQKGSLSESLGGLGAQELTRDLEDVVQRLQRIIRTLRSARPPQSASSGNLKPLPSRPGGGSNAIGLDSSSGRTVQPSGSTQVRRHLEGFLARNRMYFTGPIHGVLQMLAAQGKHKTFEAAVRQHMGRGGFPCNTHQVLHDCNVHCEMMHPGFDMRKPFCKAGCKIDNNLIKPAIAGMKRFFSDLGRKIRGAARTVRRAVRRVFVRPRR